MLAFALTVMIFDHPPFFAPSLPRDEVVGFGVVSASSTPIFRIRCCSEGTE